MRAAIKDAVHGSTALQGASTLTMQLVDNEYLPRKYRNARANHDLKYKIVQAKLAEQLEAKHSKNWILDGYLNNVPYGTVGNQTAYGAGAASWMFFDKPVSKLNLVQSALLAGLPQAPSEYNPFLFPRAARTRRAHVLGSMVRAGYITQAVANRADRARLEVKHDAPDNSHLDPYVFNYIEQQAAYDLCPKHPGNCPTLTNGGLKIKTTINMHQQAVATESLRDHASLFEEEGGPGVGGGLASVNASNGHIEAIATSGNYAQTKVNYATSAMRQTGSAFKVFALMELIHDYEGDPNTTYYDSKPLNAGWLPVDTTWSVHTDDFAYSGSINITTATYLSDNTVFAQLAADLGWTKLDKMAHAMGITSKLTGNPSEVLGGLTYGTTPLQMADAYATIADGGVHHTPTIINKIVFPDGSVAEVRQLARATGSSPTPRATRPMRFSSRCSSIRARPAPPPTTAARRRARQAPPRTWPTRGSSATRRRSRPRSGSATRRATWRWSTASAASSRRRSGSSTWRAPTAVTAATGRRRPSRSRDRVHRPAFDGRAAAAQLRAPAQEEVGQGHR